MSEISETNFIHDVVPLPRHEYPFWIKIFFLCTGIVFAYTFIAFIWYEIPYHFMISKQITNAHQFFKANDYEKAIESYSQLLVLFPNLKPVKINLAKSYFALCTQNIYRGNEEISQYYFNMGICSLDTEEYTALERKEIKAYLPIYYRNTFENCFTLT